MASVEDAGGYHVLQAHLALETATAAYESNERERQYQEEMTDGVLTAASR